MAPPLKNRTCEMDGCDRKHMALGLCRLHYYRAHRQAHPEVWRRYKKQNNLRRAYGIDVEEYATLLNEQSHRCAICGSESGAKDLNVDHDHVTGVVRGLLCRACNRGLGMFADDPHLLEVAVAYLSTT